MRAVLIDTSGSFPISEEALIKGHLRVGDRVIFFDTRPNDRGIMSSQQDIENLFFVGGGGTALESAFLYVGKNFPQAPITIITDGFIFDIQQAQAVKEHYLLVVEALIPFQSSPLKYLRELKEALL